MMEPIYDRIALQEELIMLIKKHKGSNMAPDLKECHEALDEAWAIICEDLCMDVKFGRIKL